jgi:hypothetical protein
MSVNEMVDRLRWQAPSISFCDEAADMLVELREENERLRKDAERYRWLLADEYTVSGRFNQVYRQWSGEDGAEGFTRALDAAIDSALEPRK